MLETKVVFVEEKRKAVLQLYPLFIKSFELGEALIEAELWAKKSKGQYAGYVLTYIYGIPKAIEEYGGEGLQFQLEYVLANLTGWRGDKAKESKAIIKKYTIGLMPYKEIKERL